MPKKKAMLTPSVSGLRRIASAAHAGGTETPSIPGDTIDFEIILKRCTDTESAAPTMMLSKDEAGEREKAQVPPLIFRKRYICNFLTYN